MSILRLYAKPLQLLARKHQGGDAANVARPPKHRTQKTQRLRINQHIREPIRDAAQCVPQADAVDLFRGDAGGDGESDFDFIALAPLRYGED